MPYVPQEAIEIFESGGSTKDIIGKVRNLYGDPASGRTARRWHLYFEQGIADPQASSPGREVEVNQEEVEAVVKLIKDKPMTAEQISDELDRSVRSVRAILDEIEAQGYNLARQERVVTVSTSTSAREPDKVPPYLVNNHHVKFAIVSDLHCGSKEEQVTALKHFMGYAREQGVKEFFCAGDLVAGYGVYRDQILDLYLTNADEQFAAVSRSLNIQPDERWFVLGGNHDFSFLRSGSTDALWQWCRQYPNVYYLGYDAADIPLTPQVGIRLWHPSGGVPYASSYRIQKGMERNAYEQVRDIGALVNGKSEKSDNQPPIPVLIEDAAASPIVKIVVAGHLHIDAKVHQGGVLGIQAACFEGQTNYLKKKPLYPQIGGYVVELWMDGTGMIVGERIDFRTYRPVHHDYQDWPLPIPVREPDPVEVIFNVE